MGKPRPWALRKGSRGSHIIFWTTSENQSSNSSSIADQFCGFGQIIQLLCAFNPSPIKGDSISTCSVRLLRGFSEPIYVKHCIIMLLDQFRESHFPTYDCKVKRYLIINAYFNTYLIQSFFLSLFSKKAVVQSVEHLTNQCILESRKYNFCITISCLAMNAMFTTPFFSENFAA